MDLNKNRKIFIQLFFLTVLVAFLAKLFYLQIYDDSYKDLASQNVIRKITLYPNRGLIYDREDRLIVQNDPVYDLYVIPQQVRSLDTLKFCRLLSIEKEDFIKRMQKISAYSRYRPSIFLKQLTAEDYTQFLEHNFDFPGFYGEIRTTRKYPHASAAHILGYTGEVNRALIEKEKYYKSGDYIGISGLEKHFEKSLRGKRGKKFILVDVMNRDKGPFNDGNFDTTAVSGEKLYTTLDIKLQQYGESLMRNKKGSIVAIEPASGEVLALVSSPNYNPNILTGRERGEAFKALQKDTLDPLYNRALMSSYMPGSIFKIIQALVGQQMGVLKPSTAFYCDGSKIGDHVTPGYYALFEAIKQSSNQYFYLAFKKMINQNIAESTFEDSRIGLDKWKEMVVSFGLDQKLPIDFGNTRSGYIPGSDYYDGIYGKGRWAFSTIYSISIGQGEVEMTPLQMANLSAIVANKGFYYVPHMIRGVSEPGIIDTLYTTKRHTVVDSQYFDIVMDAMQGVLEGEGGTARMSRIEGITICGKTGTVENPHGKDHSVFIAFAPREDPKIALGVIVENSGYGSTYAAPILSLMIEKYLNDTISDKRKWLEKRMLEADLIKQEE
ncbi:MAG: penicillin-binding protein 2 [Chitinophagales bacterium]